MRAPSRCRDLTRCRPTTTLTAGRRSCASRPAQPDAAGLFRIKSSLRDLDRNTTYLLDGGVTGLGAEPHFDGDHRRARRNRRCRDTDDGSGAAAENGRAAGQRPRRATRASRYELKGPLTATPDRAELPDFDLTIHAKGHPQIFKGKLALDFGERMHGQGRAELRASSISMRCSRVPGAEERPPPAAVLYMFADEVLGQAAEIRRRHAAASPSSRPALAAISSAPSISRSPPKTAQLKIERLKAVLPGENRIETSGRLTRGEFGPVFAGPVKLEGAKLAAADPLGRRRPRHVGAGLDRRFHASRPTPPSATASSSSPTRRAS